MPLKSYKTNKESLLPVFDAFKNEFREIWIFNSDLNRNTNPNDWSQLQVRCQNCGWTGVERCVGQGYKQRLVEINRQKLLRESYPVKCPFCQHVWEIEITRLFDPKTLAPDVGDDLNEIMAEVEEELKGNNRNNK